MHDAMLVYRIVMHAMSGKIHQVNHQRPRAVDQLDRSGLTYAAAHLLDVLSRTTQEEWPHFRTDDLTTGASGIRHVRGLVDELEQAGYLRRWQVGLGRGGGVVWNWQVYPNGDAPTGR